MYTLSCICCYYTHIKIQVKSTFSIQIIAYFRILIRIKVLKCINVFHNKSPFRSLCEVDEAFFIDVTQLFINSILPLTTPFYSYQA